MRSQRINRKGKVHLIKGSGGRYICAEEDAGLFWRGIIGGALGSSFAELVDQGEPTFASYPGACRRLRTLDGYPR